MPFINLMEIAEKLFVVFVNAAVFLNIVLLCNNNIHLVFFLSYESFTKWPLTWQENTNPCAGARSASSKRGAEAQDKPSGTGQKNSPGHGCSADNGVCWGTLLPRTWDLGKGD